MNSTDEYLENEKLAKKYCPLLVLFQEIEDNSNRDKHHNPDYGPGCPPLNQDYHPRDIRLVLDNARLPETRGDITQKQMLDAMSENKIDHIDLIDRGGPKEVNKFWQTYSSIQNKDGNPDYQRKAYVRVVRGSGRFKNFISIQYWLAYFFDDWANVHEMDWEMVTVVIKRTESGEEPVTCAFNAHIGSFRMPWKEVDKVNDDREKDNDGLHPVAYVANGSHASYFSDFPPDFNVASVFVGPTLRNVLRITGIAKSFTDYVPSYEDGVKCFPEVEVIPEPDKEVGWSGEWRWLNFKGHWGSPVQLSFSERLIALVPGLRKIHLFFKRPIREAAPTGPSTKGVCWDDPFYWINLECCDVKRMKPWLEKLDIGD